MNSRIGTLVHFYFFTFKRSYTHFLNKGILGKELANLICETHDCEYVTLPENLGLHKKDGSLDIPMTYENWAIANPKNKI